MLRNLAVAATGGSVLQMIPARAAEIAHQMVRQEKSAAAAGKYAAKFFSPHEYATLIFLCDTIIPKDEKSGGAVEAGAPEFIDLLSSENEHFQLTLRGGLMWLDNSCIDRYGQLFLDCPPPQQKEILDRIAFRKNGASDASLLQGIAFFAALRSMTCDGFYTSKIGIADLKYIGNTSIAEFPGCPPLDF